MTLASDVESMYSHTVEVYKALEELHCTMPAQKNLKNIVPTLDTAILYGSISYTAEANGRGAVTVYKCKSMSEFLSIIAPASVSGPTMEHNIGGVTVQRNQIVGIVPPVKLTEAPDNFLYFCSYFREEFDVSQLTKVGNNFLAYCPYFNKPLNFANLTSAGTYFMYLNASWGSVATFNSSVSFPKLQTAGLCFMTNQTKFNQPINLPVLTSLPAYFLMVDNDAISYASFNNIVTAPKATRAGAYFLRGQINFNQPVILPEVTIVDDDFIYMPKAGSTLSKFNSTISLPKAVTIGKYFLVGCLQYNKDLSLPSATTIDDYFMTADADQETVVAFNSNLSIPKVQTIGNSFLYCHQKFNKPLDLSNVTSIGTYFMYYYFDGSVPQFNSAITFTKIQTIGNYFLYDQCSFNKPLNLSTVVTIGDGFLACNLAGGLSSMASPITITSTCKTIGSSFLYDQPNFNYPLDLSGVTSLGGFFMPTYHQTPKFNSTLNLSSCKTIGTTFMWSQTAFNQNLNLSSLTSIDRTFMCNLRSYTSTVTVPSGVSYTADTYTLSTDLPSAPCYVSGIKIAGAGRAQLMSAFPNGVYGALYRKLVAV